MRIIGKVSRLLLAPPASGLRALVYAILLIAIPTAIRLLLDEILGGGYPFIIYMPFLILTGALLSWRYAAIVSALAWLTGDLLFMQPRFSMAFDVPQAIGLIIFATSSFLIIGLAESVRTIVESSLRPARPDGVFSAPVVFSLERGHAWASWYGSNSWVRLGPEEEVAEMMRDFLAQQELGKRLGSNDTAVP